MNARSLAAFLALTASAVGGRDACAQDHPVTWRLADSSAVTAGPGATVAVRIVATIPRQWHVYSPLQPPGGPVAMRFEVDPARLFTLGTNIDVPPPIMAPDPNFSITSAWYADSAAFTLPVVVARAAGGTQRLSVRVTYQACTDRYCLPPTEDTLTVAVRVAGAPVLAPPLVVMPPRREAPVVAATGDSVRSGSERVASRPATGALGVFLGTAFIMGFLALLTPCVFPMVPITISYFSGAGRRAGSGLVDAALYAGGIVGAFTALGLGASLLFGIAGVNRFASHPVLNLAIAALFIAFAISLFGALDIALPPRMIAALDRASRGNAAGRTGTTLLMGGTFALTTFTCTAPFVGTLLVSAASGDWKWAALGLLTFASAFALPFFALALVPGALERIPRSGSWMMTLKGTLAFVELAAATKFISNADLVLGWGVFSRQTVIAIWVALGVGAALYLAGLRVSRNGTESSRRRHPFAAALTLILTGWMATGFGGKRLGELEAFLPPAGDRASGVARDELEWMTDDLEGALVRAGKENRLVLIDFTGFTCTNCRWMEANMFPKDAVQRELREFVRVRLFTDGSGQRFRDQQRFERDKFGTVALPLYAVVGADGSSRATFLGMTRSEPEFVEFLSGAREVKSEK